MNDVLINIKEIYGESVKLYIFLSCTTLKVFNLTILNEWWSIFFFNTNDDQVTYSSYDYDK